MRHIYHMMINPFIYVVFLIKVMSDLHIPSLKCLANCLEDTENLKVKKINFELEKWGHLFSTYVKFSEKLT